MIRNPSIQPSRFDTDIIELTSGEIRSFLHELREGTSRYKSIHNLTGEIEHNYHGRFLVELIQNAYDALPMQPESKDNSRIEIVLVPDDGEYGTLYIANDGSPFSKSNFEHLSKLGQSDKDPAKSIGNKGIGFRSVLEIADSPEIYSSSSMGTKVFDGYCFSFSPSTINTFGRVIIRLVEGKDDVSNPLNNSESLINDWSKEQINKFHDKLNHHARNWIENELNCLSPYSLPCPIDKSSINNKLQEFAERGFVTVICLKLKSSEALELTRNNIEAVDANSVLFLERVTSVTSHGK